MNRRLTAWQFICRILAPLKDPEAISQLQHDMQVRKEIWPQVIRFADAHLVTPALWAGIRRKGLVEYLPEEPRQYIEALYEMNAQRNASLLSQLDEAIRVLNSRGVVPVLLKGAAYLKTNVYEDPAERIFTDLDVLVDESQIPLAFDALQGCGYRAAPGSGFDYTRHRHCPPMFRSGDYGTIEVHRHLLDPKLAEILPDNVAWEASIEKRQQGMSYRHLSPSHMLILSFLHSQIIDGLGESFTVAFRPIQDLQALETTYKERIEWDKIYALLKRHAVENRFRDYLFAASQVAEFRVLPEIRFGPREWAHYAIAQARIRWARIERLNIWEFSSDWIRRRYGDDQKNLRLNYYRLRLIGEVVSRRARMALSLRGTNKAVTP